MVHFAGEMAEETADAGEGRPREQLFLLNSRCLTALILGKIATELGVPSGGSLADTKQMVEGAFSEHGRQPSNVQVSLLETGGGVAIRLEDEDGIFMEIPPPETEEPTDGAGSPRVSEEETERQGGTGTGPREEELDTMTTITAELRTVHDKITKLEGEVSI